MSLKKNKGESATKGSYAKLDKEEILEET